LSSEVKHYGPFKRVPITCTVIGQWAVA